MQSLPLRRTILFITNPAEVMSKFSHPNVLGVMGISVAENTLSIITPLALGGSLDSYIAGVCGDPRVQASGGRGSQNPLHYPVRQLESGSDPARGHEWQGHSSGLGALGDSTYTPR